MRIAFVTESWHPSTDGVVTRLSATIKDLRERGHEVLVIAPRGRASQTDGVEVREVPTIGFRFIYGGRRWGLPLPRVSKYLKDFQPDLVHVVNPVLLGMAGVWAAKRVGIPLVASYHTDVSSYAAFYHLGWLQPVIRFAVRMMHRQAVVNLATSGQRCDELSSLGAPNVRLWRRGVDLELFHPSRRTRQTSRTDASRRTDALYVGRIGKEKDIHRLASLVEPPDRFHLTLVGDGPDRERLSRRLASGPVSFTGTLHGKTLAETYANADVFVFPSTTETLGLVLLEALASGLPVIAVDTPASREITGNCRACRLFPADEPDQLPRLVKELLASGTASELTSAARAEAERWSWQAATDDLLSHYADACGWQHAAVGTWEDGESSRNVA